MLYRIFGGLTFLFMGINCYSSVIPPIIIGIFAFVAGIALLAGI